MTAGITVSAAISLVVGFVTTWLVVKIAPRVGLIDTPNPRSSHVRPTPRGGGIGVVAGAAAGVAALSVAGAPPGGRLTTLLLGSLAIAAAGVIDDLRTLPAPVRLVVQLVVAAPVSIALGGINRLPLPAPLDLPTGALAWPLGTLWLAAVTNFYNFMDGIDGLAAGQAVASCIGVAVAAWAIDASNFALILAASALGFLALNRPPAKIFLGDVGSTSIGFTLAGLGMLAGTAHRAAAVLAVAVGLTLFLLDPLETLVRLARRGHRIGSAHRWHSYQILARANNSHAAVTGMLLVGGLVLAVAGAVSYRAPALAWPTLFAAMALYTVERYLASRTSARHAELNGGAGNLNHDP